MGCTPSAAPTTAVAPAEQIDGDNHLSFTIDERLKLKEVWVVVKQNNLKKLGDEIMIKALENNSTLINYWQNSAFLDQGNNLTFSESESIVNTEVLVKQSYQQHGYKILDKIDQLIMVMVTRINTNNNNQENVLKEYFQRIAETHSELKMKQDHIDMLSLSIIECLKNVMYQNGSDWTIKHEMTWMKLLNLITNQFMSPQTNSPAKPKHIS